MAYITYNQDGSIKQMTGTPTATQLADNPTISAASLKPTAPIQLPNAPTYSDLNPAIAGANATLAGNAASLAPQQTDPTTALFEKYLSSSPKSPNLADIYNTDYNNSGIDQYTKDLQASARQAKDAQDAFASTQAQIQGLAAESQAAQIAVEGQGGLSTQLSGRQAAIARNYAIRAIPLQVQAYSQQAQVAAAQGNQQLAQSIVDQAKSHLDTVFQIHAQDAQAQYQYKKSVIDAVYNFANAQEQRKLDALSKQQDRQFQAEQSTLAYQRDLQKMNLENTLKQNDPLYQAQLAKAQADVTPTGVQVTDSAGKKVVIPTDTYNERQDTINIINSALADPYLKYAVGGQLLNPLNYIPGGANQNVKALLSQVQAKLALDNRAKLKGSGAISDFESRTLNQAASAFNVNLSYADAQKQLTHIAGALTTANGGQAQIVAKDKSGNVSKPFYADTAAINKMIADGLIVEYQ